MCRRYERLLLCLGRPTTARPVTDEELADVLVEEDEEEAEALERRQGVAKGDDRERDREDLAEGRDGRDDEGARLAEEAVHAEGAEGLGEREGEEIAAEKVRRSNSKLSRLTQAAEFVERRRELAQAAERDGRAHGEDGLCGVHVEHEQKLGRAASDERDLAARVDTVEDQRQDDQSDAQRARVAASFARPRRIARQKKHRGADAHGGDADGLGGRVAPRREEAFADRNGDRLARLERDVDGVREVPQRRESKVVRRVVRADHDSPLEREASGK
mmetsp:Transcript_7180/g.29843  ORF Transcript_7180/g.29843 Transcript_7180/m.29843 type:complete len:274 (-) Transcript_7180:462-1283(-)